MCDAIYVDLNYRTPVSIGKEGVRTSKGPAELKIMFCSLILLVAAPKLMPYRRDLSKFLCITLQ